MITMLGMIAGICTSISFFPQAIQTIRTKQTEGGSLSTYIMFVLGVFTWIIYGAIKGDVAVFMTNLLTIFPCITILYLKIQAIKAQKIKC